jgi:two-component system phosphate regulon sensor histidine kinase PhoR
MYADKGKIHQLVSNLLDNAIKYSLPGGRIELSLIKQGTFIVFSITDNGIGIPIPEQDRVFERFYRVDKARSGDTPGTGLGLAIVKHIVDLHKGSITLISNRNEGSTFTVSIPENLTQS